MKDDTKMEEVSLENKDSKEIEQKETTYDLFLKLLEKDKNIDFGYGF